MPNSIYAQIYSALGTLLNADLGDFDFTNRASFGRSPVPPQVPWITVDIVGVKSADDSSPLGTYEHTATYEIEAWAQYVGATAFLNPSNMASEIQTVIQNAHRSSGSLKALGVRRVNFPETEFRNTERNGISVAHVVMTLEIVYTTLAGI